MREACPVSNSKGESHHHMYSLTACQGTAMAGRMHSSYNVRSLTSSVPKEGVGIRLLVPLQPTCIRLADTRNPPQDPGSRFLQGCYPSFHLGVPTGALRSSDHCGWAAVKPCMQQETGLPHGKCSLAVSPCLG